MNNFFRCKKCLFPSTKPSLHFDKDQVCMACKFTDFVNAEIDWKKKEKDFLNLCKEIKKNKQSDYDCIIPVSGGKDSTYQTYVVKEIGGLNPLLVNFEPSCPTEIGIKNLNNLKESFNCDLIQLKKSEFVYSNLSRTAFEIVGDHEWPNHVGIYVWPIRMALKLKIPYVFYGESSGYIGQGRWDKLEDQKFVDRNWVEEHSGMIGLRLNDILDFNKSLKKENVYPYIYPSEEELLKNKLYPYLTGFYFKWDIGHILPLIQKFGWKTSEKKIEGDYGNWEDLDCDFMPIHHYFKYVKYGYARATDHACSEIRRGRLSRKEGKELILNNEGKLPQNHFKKFLKFLNISEEKFYEIRNKFTNPILFKRGNNNSVLEDKDHNLIPEDILIKSFDE